MPNPSHALAALVLLLAAVPAHAQAELKSDRQKFSYALGAQMGQNVLNQGVELDFPALIEGLRDITSGAELKLTPEEMQQAAQRFQQEQLAKRQELAEENQKLGTQFREKNRQQNGVKELPSGIQYKVLQPGSGKQPKLEDNVVVNYRGTHIDGEEFDSSYKRGEPVTLQLNRVIKGWQEALTMMQEGAKWQIVVPPELAYGERGAGATIGPNETLVFEVELLKVEPAPQDPSAGSKQP